eukprot:COSAG02_NODE_493_length_21166_cov_13.181318_15_plen_65_part_00
MMMNFLLCLGAIAVICFVFLHSISVVVLTAILIAMIDIDLVGSIQCVARFSVVSSLLAFRAGFR